MPQPLEIRALTGPDAEAFWRLRSEALDLEPRAFGEAAEEHRATPIETFATRFAAAGGDTFVLGAFLHGQLVGTAGFFRNQTLKRRHKGRIWGMYVAPAVRGNGAGRALLTTLLDRIATIPELDEVILSVTEGQDAAKKLYLSLGFVEFGHETNALRVGGEPVDEYYMALRLRR